MMTVTMVEEAHLRVVSANSDDDDEFIVYLIHCERGEPDHVLADIERGFNSALLVENGERTLFLSIGHAASWIVSSHPINFETNVKGISSNALFIYEIVVHPWALDESFWEVNVYVPTPQFKETESLSDARMLKRYRLDVKNRKLELLDLKTGARLAKNLTPLKKATISVKDLMHRKK